MSNLEPFSGARSISDGLPAVESTQAPEAPGQSVPGASPAAPARKVKQAVGNRNCNHCGKELPITMRAHAKYCDNKCRAAAWKVKHDR